MLDAILYGYDQQGRLTLKERSVADLSELAADFSTPGSAQWRWVEITDSTASGSLQIVRHTVAELQAMMATSSRARRRNRIETRPQFYRPCYPKRSDPMS